MGDLGGSWQSLCFPSPHLSCIPAPAGQPYCCHLLQGISTRHGLGGGDGDLKGCWGAKLLLFCAFRSLGTGPECCAYSLTAAPGWVCHTGISEALGGLSVQEAVKGCGSTSSESLRGDSQGKRGLGAGSITRLCSG